MVLARGGGLLLRKLTQLGGHVVGKDLAEMAEKIGDPVRQDLHGVIHGFHSFFVCVRIV